MQTIDRKEFVQGVAAHGVATVAEIPYGKEGSDMKKTELKSKKHMVKVIGKPVCEIPPSRSIIKNVHSQGGEIGEVYIGRQTIIAGKDLSLCPNSQVALKVNYPVEAMMYVCEIVSATPEKIVVESPKRFETKYMRESAIGLTGEVILYLNDPRRRNRQAAHGSRFKVKFVRPQKGK